ncbi:MAG: diaminopimelate decarboxylase, partial [Elusimicrobiota bacterium]
MFRYVKNKLFVEDVPVEEISQKTGTPVYVYSKKKILENLNNYDKAFSSVRHILCYAMKANSNPFILREIFSTGAGVDITSGGELYRALKAGVSPGRVVFAGIGKSPEEIAYAARCGILMFNSESLDEVRLIDSIGRKLK